MLSLVIVVFLQLDDYAIPAMRMSSTFHTYFNSTTKFWFHFPHVKNIMLTKAMFDSPDKIISRASASDDIANMDKSL
ncbi:hypothetical protein KDW_19320 [Dictyobacter vulcani]|uniref:Uncharacterized protein n=1 Tax=Dictyobacter vulcani TaxID=2607529 RepID=A0A5J4KMX8_9CHLR|nr:hypothetical protein KDW_19320 [Dictyobacter vulcani]